METIAEADVPYSAGEWPSIPLLTTRDSVRGGSGGPSNQQAIALYRRTETLKTQWESLKDIGANVLAAQKAAADAAESARIVDPNTLNRKVDSREGFSLVAETEINKLSGIAAGATKNSSDESLLDRRNHKNKQSIGTIENLENILQGLVTKEQLDFAIAGVGAFTDTPTEFKGSAITVTSPHTRQMIWAGNKYIRAPWDRPGVIKLAYGDVFPGTLVADGFTEYTVAQYPDLAEYLGVSAQETFVLDKPIEFGTFNVCVSY